MFSCAFLFFFLNNLVVAVWKIFELWKTSMRGGSLTVLCFFYSTVVFLWRIVTLASVNHANKRVANKKIVETGLQWTNWWMPPQRCKHATVGVLLRIDFAVRRRRNLMNRISCFQSTRLLPLSRAQRNVINNWHVALIFVSESAIQVWLYVFNVIHSIPYHVNFSGECFACPRAPSMPQTCACGLKELLWLTSANLILFSRQTATRCLEAGQLQSN